MPAVRRVGGRSRLLLIAAAASVGCAETHYGIVFDAGSSGSRIHVYSWNTGGGGPKDQFDLLKDDLLKIEPGLSAHKANPSEAGKSLRPLLDYAKTKIPAELVSQTPCFLMATAGLRLVGEAVKDQILSSVCTELQASGFFFKCEWASLLDGQTEGLFGWVTVNYLLDKLYPPPTEPPVGIIDLGGGSVQIVFATDGAALAAAPAGYAKQLDFGSRSHSVYIKSHLGFGLDEARKNLIEEITRKQAAPESPVHNPCLPKGKKVTYKDVEMVGEGDFKHCMKFIQKHLFPQKPCSHGSSCSIAGAYQPKLPGTVYGFSYMYDRTAAIGLLDGTPKVFGEQVMSRADIEAAGTQVCALDEAQTTDRFAKTKDAKKSENYCGDVAYIAVLLGEFGFDESTKVTMTNKIKEVELVWTLGAMLAKSAELAAAAKGGLFSSSALMLLVPVALALFFFMRRSRPSPGYSAVHRETGNGRPST